jgi:hypothetical protein
MVRIINVADMVNPNDPQGRTYRVTNALITHQIPVGVLVELENGERLYVKRHERDCDQTPMYSLGMEDEDRIEWWLPGFAEQDLTIIKPTT